MSEGAGGLLPPGFLLGVATSGYQVEGGFNGPHQPANNWLAWEHSGRAEPSGVACDFWAHPEPVLDRAAGLGCNAFRLSVEWSRVEPEDGQLDEGALGRYAAILAGCAERGLEPVVTLSHFTHPWWLGEEFWLTPGSPDRFARHVARVVERLASGCRRWVTVNEPNVLALMGWVTGAHPPGRRVAAADASAVIDNLLSAHVLAYRALHGAQPEALVTLTTSASSIYDYDRLLVDLLTVRAHGVGRSDVDEWIDERRALHDLAVPPASVAESAMRALFAAVSPYGTGRGRPKGTAGRRPLTRRVPRRVLDLVFSGPETRLLDASAFDWYDPAAAHALRWPGHRDALGRRRWRATRALWDAVPDAEGLGRWCEDEAVRQPGLPQWVAENGMATLVRAGRAVERADGWDRPRFVRQHLAALVGVLSRGAPVGAYLHWSLVDNYEWGSYDPRFGLYGLERRADGPPRWLDTDAAGAPAAEAFARIVAGLRRGDASVLVP
jgi:beta-glucosidase/6-phospho-beta-glucosidase/beta-galactosidase